MRSYSALLVFESLLDTPPSTANSQVRYLYNQVISPTVQVTEADCGTLLGEVADVNFESEGRVELATELPLSDDRITQLLSQGVYKVRTRTLSTCISSNGVCAACYSASRPNYTPVPVGGNVQITPEFEKASEAFRLQTDSTVVTLSYQQDTYDYIIVFINGVFQVSSNYSVSGTVITFNTSVLTGSLVTIRYMSRTTAPFMLWLASTYSGSLLGLKALPGPLLPIRSLLLESLVSQPLLEDVVSTLSSNPPVPSNMVQYLGSTHNILEKAMFALSLNSVFEAAST